MKSLEFSAIVWFGLLAVGAWGCPSQEEELPFVSLEPPLRVADAEPPIEQRVIRVGVAPIFSPVAAYEQFADLMSYLSTQLGQPVALVQRPTYFEINELVRSGDLSCAFVCSGAYVLNGEGLSALVTPVVSGEPTYRAICLVPTDSPVQRLSDLSGASFAVTDPLSFTGRAYMGRRVAQLGSTPDGFFGRVLHVEGHDTTLKLLSSNSVDGACVSSMVHEKMELLFPELAQQLRVVETSDPFGAPPVVVSARAPPEARAKLARVFEGMNSNPDGAVILEALGVDRFERPAPDLYSGLAEFLDAGSAEDAP